MFRLFYRVILSLWLTCILVVMGLLAVRQTVADESTLGFLVLERQGAARYLLDTNTGVISPLSQHAETELLSPNGQNVLLPVWQFESIELYVADADGQNQRRVGSYNLSPVRNHIQWDSTGEHIILVVQKEEKGTQVYRVNATTGQLSLLGDYTFNAWGSFYSPDRRYLILRDASNTPQGGILIDLTTGASHRFAAANQYYWSANSRFVAYLSPNLSVRAPLIELHILNVETQQVEDYSTAELGGWQILPALIQPFWSPDDESLVLTLYKDDEVGLFIARLADGELTLLQAGTWGIMDWSLSGRYLLISNLQATTAVLDTQTGQRTDLFTGAVNLAYGFVAWSEEAGYIAFDYLPSGFRDNRVLRVYEIATGREILARDLPLSDYYPALQGDEAGLIWWQADAP